MAQATADSPKRAWLKASEVCDLAKVQPYVLRTWELEFPDLGVVKTPGGPRMYRPADLEQVRRIRELVFDQGLTLAGARRRIEEDRTLVEGLPFDEPAGEPAAPLPRKTRTALAQLRRDLRSLLDMLGGPPADNGHPAVRARSTTASEAAAGRKRGGPRPKPSARPPARAAKKRR